MRLQLQGDLQAKEFSNLILKIGNGLISEVNGRIDIPSNLCELALDLDSLMQKVYSNLAQGEVKPGHWLKGGGGGHLIPPNDLADEINKVLSGKLLDPMLTYDAIDSVMETKNAANYPVEFLNSLYPLGIPPHFLHLKVGAPIILLQNLNSPKLCNGTRLQVNSLKNHLRGYL